jgi:hypothetical protein
MFWFKIQQWLQLYVEHILKVFFFYINGGIKCEVNGDILFNIVVYQHVTLHVTDRYCYVHFKWPVLL